MRQSMRLIAAAAFLSVAGCGGGQTGVPVGGTVTRDGSPITFGDSEGVTLTLTGGGDTFTANVGPDGTFSVQRPGGGGIPPGKYKVKCLHYQNASPYTKSKPFRTEKELPEEWDVKSGGGKFTVDLDAK